MGTVYEAEDPELQRRVAIKVLRPDLAANPRSLKRFKREARAVAALNHPNVVTLHSFEEDGNIHFLTMELVKGVPLSQLVPDGGLSLKELLSRAMPLAEGLHAAHERGIVHRDLKPANVMIDAGDRLRILDFGLAKLRPTVPDADSQDSTLSVITSQRAVVGTVPYMSPEQVTGQKIDHRSDLFSFGVILYEMATGRRPFGGETNTHTMSAILRDTPPPVSETREDLPEHLGRIVRRCLEKEPEKRYQSAEALRGDLESLQREMGSGQELVQSLRNEFEDLRQEVASGRSRRAGPSTTEPRSDLPRWFEKVGWLQISLTGVLLIALVAASFFYLRSKRSVGGYDTIAVLPFANLTGNPEQSYISEGIALHLIGQLSELVGLQVTGRGEAWSYLGSDLSASQLGKKLGVGLLLEGEVQQEKDELQVNVRLTDAAHGTVLWAEEFRRNSKELFGLQKDLGSGLTRILDIPLSFRERRRLARDPSASFRAYDYYLQGQQFLGQVSRPRSPDMAAEVFRQAIQLDPDFALAHAGLSEALWRIYQRENDGNLLDQAEEEAERAAALDPDLPAAQVARARVYRSTGRYGQSIAELRQVLARHPKPDEAEGELAFSYEQSGDLKAAEEALIAATRLRPDHWHHWNSLGAFLVKMARYPEAREAFERANELAPQGLAWPLINLATLKLLAGDSAGAIEAFEQFKGQVDDAKLAANIGTAYYFENRLEDAEKYYQLAVKLDPKDPLKHGNLADLYLRQEKFEKARAEYQTALEFVEEALLDNPKSPGLRVDQALYAAKSGDCAIATGLADALAVELSQTAQTVHDRAIVYALCRQRSAALEAIRTAIELGISAQLIRREDEFAFLQADQEFVSLTLP
jgi:serine/threonine protein kinase/tetratricopeptide (TPR) repeat protein